MPEPQVSSALAAYEAFADAYDAFTSRNNYELWLSKALPELERHDLKSAGRLLDVGCGSGNSFLPMLARGWTVTACDLSPAMVEIARRKAGSEVALSVADMRALPVLGEFDLIWAIDDAVNYLLGNGDLAVALAGMKANLAPGGLVVFDVNTLTTYRHSFSAREVSTRGGREVIWTGLSASDAEPRTVFEAQVEGEGIEPHVHRQRHYSEGEIREAILAAGLSWLDSFGYDDQVNITRPPDDLQDPKVSYVATNERAPRRAVDSYPITERLGCLHPHHQPHR